MKKTILSEEALRTLLADAPTEENLEGVDPDKIASTEAPTEAQSQEQPSELDALRGEFEKFKAEAELKVTDLEAATEALQVELADANGSVVAMKDIIAGQIKRMRVGLSLAAVDFSEMKAADVVKEFNSISAQFMKAIPVGSVVPEEKESQVGKVAIATSIDESKFRALGFGVKTKGLEAR